MSGTGSEPKIENKIPSGEIKWRTDDNGKIEITADGTNWLDSKTPKKDLIVELKNQLNADKQNDEEDSGFHETSGMNLASGGGKKSKKHRSKNKRHTRKNKK